MTNIVHHNPPSPSAPIIGHVGDGNFHTMILVDPEDSQQVAAAKELSHRMARYTLALFPGHGLGTRLGTL